MAEEHNATTVSAGEEVAVHAHDYARFIKMLKWSTLVVAIIAAIVLMILG